jgi:hypothetical protein
MFDREEYPSMNAMEFEANWMWNHALEVTHDAVRAEPEQVKIARHLLQLHATDGWRLTELKPLIRGRAFVSQRPGSRPGRSERAAIEAMTPAECMKSLFTKGLAFDALPDDLVYAAMLAYAQTHYGASHLRAARRLAEAVIRCLAVRAGIEPVTEELTHDG